jgi:16S rRNA (adenine1518-N6/adenine1519-N6)-dimethyltransferase
VADAAHLTQTDIVLEIGPGHGILTRELLARAGKVVAVEKDPVLVAELRETFAADITNGRLTLIEQDIRDFDPYNLQPTTYSLVANIPYYITGYIIRKFLTTQHQPHTLAVLIQKEVAERIVASDGRESLLSLSVKAYGTPALVRIVKAGAFNPPPKVDSAILAVHSVSRSAFSTSENEAAFFEMLHAAFSQKRKQLRGTLGSSVADTTYAFCDVTPSARPESLSTEQWLCLARCR